MSVAPDNLGVRVRSKHTPYRGMLAIQLGEVLMTGIVDRGEVIEDLRHGQRTGDRGYVVGNWGQERQRKEKRGQEIR